MNDPAFSIEINRLAISQSTDARTKSQLGQFFTPATTAQFMAELFPESNFTHCKLLDAGAGIGSLTHAFLARHTQQNLAFEHVQVTTCEVDHRIHEALNQTLQEFKTTQGLNHFDYNICGEDFIEQSVNRLQFEGGAGYTHAILNPPYKKISSNSKHRLLLRQVGIEAVNLYAAFVSLALLQMMSNGLLVAILPRSFCNGPYYLPFRKFILKESSIERIHLFESRNQTFKDDSVLQENIIIVLKRHGKQNKVVISTSKDDTFKNLVITTHSFENIISKSDAESIIHIPVNANHLDSKTSNGESFSLSEIGIQVSTGPVVDFRLKSHLRAQSEPNCVPLLYPCHFSNLRKQCEWPKENSKKANAIQHNSDTEKWLYPNGFYCVIKRFSSKEEKRRIGANVVSPKLFNNAEYIGFENHLNILHENKKGLSEDMAWGLSAYLNSEPVDNYFRSFSGHTQVNASDLKRMKYPSREKLLELGAKYKQSMTNHLEISVST